MKKCCAKTIQSLWKEKGGSENIVQANFPCNKCRENLYVTHTSKEEANQFLLEHKLKQQ